MDCAGTREAVGFHDRTRPCIEIEILGKDGN